MPFVRDWRVSRGGGSSLVLIPVFRKTARTEYHHGVFGQVGERSDVPHRTDVDKLLDPKAHETTVKLHRGLYEVRYRGGELGYEPTMKLVRAFNDSRG